MNQFRRIFIDGELLSEVIEVNEYHGYGGEQLTVTVKFNAKKIEIESDAIRITTFKPIRAVENR